MNQEPSPAQNLPNALAGAQPYMGIQSPAAPRSGGPGGPNRADEMIKYEQFDPSALHGFKKPAALLGAQLPHDGAALCDLKLLNVLLACAAKQLAADQAPTRFTAPAVLLRRAIGQRSSRNNLRLRKSLDRLAKPVVFPDLGSTGVQVAPIQHWRMDGAEVVEWMFPPSFISVLSAPAKWAWIDLKLCARFTRRAALVLHEQLRLVAGRNWPSVTFDVQRLREMLTLGPSAERGSDLLGKTIKPAIKEIERLASMKVEIQIGRERRHRTLQKITFRVAASPVVAAASRSPLRPRGLQQLPRAQSPVGRPQEATAISFLDGAGDAGAERARGLGRSGATRTSPKKAIYELGVKLLVAAGQTEPAARSLIGKLRSGYDDGFVATALEAAWEKGDVIDPYPWIVSFLRRNYPTRQEHAIRSSMGDRSSGARPRARALPLATPEFLGISSGMQRKIQARNAALRDMRICDLPDDDAEQN